MNSEKKSKIITFMVWLSITMFYCYQYILRILPNLAMPDIMSKYGIGASEFGSFAGIYYIGYIIVHIPVGILLSRFGGKLILPVFILLTSLGLVPMAYFDNWNGVLMGRMLTGIGSSAAIVGALQIFRVIYPDSFTRMVGIMAFFSLITAIYSGTPLANILKSIGLGASLNILIWSGIILAIVTYVLMPGSAGETSHTSIGSDIKSILFNYKLLMTSIFAGLMVGPVEGFADGWGSAFLREVYGMSKSAGDSTTLAILLGMCAGFIILPYVADKTRYYFGTTIFSGLVMTACFIYMLGGSANHASLYYVCIVIGIFCAYQVVIISRISTFVSEERSGLAAAVANMIIMAFGWVFHNSIGFVLDRHWEGIVIDGVKKYSSEAFINSISLIPIASFVAITGLTLIVGINGRQEKKIRIKA